MMTLKSTLSLIFVLVIYKADTFRIFCPEPSARYLRSKAKCTHSSNYTCLFDENQNYFSESCSVKSDFQRPGYRVTLRTNIHAGPCPEDLYQPFTFFTNTSSNCELKRSFCSGKGQLVSSNGTTKTDRQCRCNYANGYSYVIQPSNICSCIPSVEDCSCYRKTCSRNHILSPDYQCIDQSNWSGKFLCSSISDLRVPKVNVSGNGIHKKEVLTDVRILSLIRFPLLTLVLLVLFIIFMWMQGVIAGASSASIGIQEKTKRAPLLSDGNAVEDLPGSFVSHEKECLLETSKEIHAFAEVEENGENTDTFDISYKYSMETQSAISLKTVSENILDGKQQGTQAQREISKKEEDEDRFEIRRHDTQIEDRTEIENKKGSFIETDFTRKVKQKLTKSNYMLMWGKPGCGKTASLRYIAKYLQDDFGYKVVPCYKPSDIFKNEGKDEKQLFIVDDICGKFVFSFEIFSRWKRRTKHIERLIQADKTKLLMTCSSSVFMSDIVQKFNIFTDNAIEITTHPMSLHDLNEDLIKDSTLSVIIEHNLFDQLPLSMIKLGRYLPMREALEYFADSSNYIKKKVDELRDSNFSAFCSIFLIILKKGCIAEIVMTSDNHRMFTTISRNVFKELNVDISRRRFMDNLLFLMDIFVTKENGLYSIRQTYIFEALAVYFGETLQELFIRNADPEIITQHCSLEKCPTVLGETFDIYVREKNETLYFQRIREQLLRGNISEVLAVRQMKLSSYQQKFAEFFRKLGTDVVKQIARSKCKIERETTFTLVRRYVYVDLLKLFFDCDPKLSLEDYPYLEIACKTNNYNLAKFFVSKEMDMNKYSSDGCTPLHIACKNGFFNLVFLLVSKGADVNCTEQHGNTPLIQVCEKENEKVITFLLDNGADINKSNSDGQVPLMISASKNRNKIVDLLIKRNADVNIVDCSGLTCLMYAIKSEFENLETVMTLLKSGVDVNVKSEDGKTAIIVAIQMQRKDVITFLTDSITDATYIGHSELNRNNANTNNINQGDNRGITPLIYACELRNEKCDVVEYLVSKGAMVNCSDFNDRTPLVVALVNNDDKLVEYLLNHNANVNLPGNKRTTPLHEMCKIGQCDSVVLLISNKCDVDIVDRKSMTPLMIASACGFSEITKVLIQANAKINIADHKGTTALMLACTGGFIDVIRDLVENKADVNKTDKNNWTALLAYANSQYDNAEIVDFLISQGANVNSTTNDEVSSLMMASFHGHEEIVKCLIQHEADVNHKDSYGKTPIFSACLSGNVDIVRLLIKKGADAEVVDKNGDTLKSLARKNNLTKMLDFFCKK